MYNDNSKYEYYIIVKDGKIVKAGRSYISKVEHLSSGDVIHNTVNDALAKYTIDETKTFDNKYIGGKNEVLYFYTEQ